MRSGNALYEVLHWEENDTSDAFTVDGVALDIAVCAREELLEKILPDSCASVWGSQC